MAQSSTNEKSNSRPKAKLTHPDGFLDELDGDASQDPDALLAEVVPNIDKEMGQLNADFSNISVDIETLDLDGEEDDDVPITLKEKFQAWKRRSKTKIKGIASELFFDIKYFLIWFALEAPKKILKIAKIVGARLKVLGNVFSHWSKKRKILFVLSTVAFAAIIVGYVNLMKSGILYKESYQYVGSLEELADYSITLDQTAQFEPFYNSPRVKAYSFQMKPVVVNLKRKEDSNQVPMGFFEFVFEGNSGDVVVEMKLRESEFVDVMSRVIEGYSYETLDTVDGKERLKEELRKELNKELTEGVIRRVEIGNFFIKP